MAESWSSLSNHYKASVGLIPAFYSDIAAEILFSDFPVEPVAFMDVAAGPGILSSAILQYLERNRRQFPSDSSMLITDYAEGMVEKAVERFHDTNLEQYGLSSVQCLVMDACNPVVPPQTPKITHLGCMFGILFFPDRQGALTKLHELMVPGGKALFGTWYHADFAVLCYEFAVLLCKTEEDRLGMPSIVEPLPCYDPKETEAELLQAGYSDIVIRQEERTFVVTHDESLFNVFAMNPVIKKYPTLAKAKMEEMHDQWFAYLHESHPVGKKWLVDDGRSIALRYVGNVIEARA